jgi:hypothetical protein
VERPDMVRFTLARWILESRHHSPEAPCSMREVPQQSWIRSDIGLSRRV